VITDRAVALAEAIAALPEDHSSDDVWALFGPDEYEIFHFMDDTPGHECFTGLRDGATSYGEWHRRLRAARNDPEATWPFR
jgi:hypothetical protein